MNILIAECCFSSPRSWSVCIQLVRTRVFIPASSSITSSRRRLAVMARFIWSAKNKDIDIWLWSVVRSHPVSVVYIKDDALNGLSTSVWCTLFIIFIFSHLIFIRVHPNQNAKKHSIINMHIKISIEIHIQGKSYPTGCVENSKLY